MITRSMMRRYNVSFKMFDRGIIEVLGPYGIVTTLRSFTKKISDFQTGYIYHYAFILLIGITLLLTFLGLWNFTLLFNIIDSRLFLIYLATILFYNKI